MTTDQLKDVMKFHLTSFNDEGIEINDETIHNHVLSEDDGYGMANSKTIYKLFIRRTLKRAGHPDKNWPADWFESNVSSVAERII